MDYYSGAPEPSEFDYNNGGQGSSGGNVFDFFRKNSFIVLLLLAALIAILIVVFFLTGGGEAPDYNTKDKDSYLSELYVSGGIIDPMFEPDVTKYKVITDSDYVTFSCKARSDKAKVKGCEDSVEVNEKKAIVHEIEVTAEDTTVTIYKITIEKIDHFDEGY